MSELATGELSDNTSAVASTLTQLGKLRDAQGRYEEAVESHQQAFELYKDAFGEDDPDTWAKLDDVATSLAESGRYDEALAAQGQVLAALERIQGKDHSDVAQAVSSLGWMYCEAGRPAEAEPLIRRVLEICAANDGQEDELAATAWNNLGLVLNNLSRYREARDAYERALQLNEQLSGRDSLEVAVTVDNLASLDAAVGHYTQAESGYQRSLAIRQRQLGDVHPDTLETWNNLAVLYSDTNRLSDAEDLLRQILAAQAHVLPEDHPSVAATLSNLAVVLYSQAQWAEAEPLLKRSLEIQRKTHGDQSADVAQCWNNLGTMYRDQGRLHDAEVAYRSALQVQEKLLGSAHIDVGDTLSNLALLLGEKNSDEALSLLERAAAIREQNLPADHPDLALSLINLATECVEFQNPDRAAKFVEHAAGIVARAPVACRHLAMPLLRTQALIATAAGDKQQAVAYINQALELPDSTIQPLDRADALQVRAILLWELGQQDRAIEDLDRALELGDQQRSKVYGAEQERAFAAGQSLSAWEQLLTWRIERGELTDAWNAAERSRARTLLEQLDLAGVDLLAGLPASEADALRAADSACQTRLAEAERLLELLDTSKADDEAAAAVERDRLVAEVVSARQALVDSYLQLRSASPAWRAALGKDQQPISLGAWKIWLADQQAIALYYVLGEFESWRFVVDGGDLARIDPLVIDESLAQALGTSAGPLTAAAVTQALQLGEVPLLNALARPTLAPEVAQRLEALRRLLIPADVESRLYAGQYKRLAVIPDGQLSTLPFEVLVVRQVAPIQFFLDLAPPTLYGPSATVLHRLASRPKAPATDESVLTVGDPQYGGPSTAAPRAKGRQPRRGQAPKAAPRKPPAVLAATQVAARWGGAGGTLVRLPYSGQEARWVEEVFEKQGVRSRRLVGPAATEMSVRKALAGRRIAHLACHGLADHAYGNFFGALALTPGNGDLADDGFLTLPEIYELPLDGCELAVLSACQTNQGPVQRGEGVFALSRGFLVAGARRVVASNWIVDDESAASLISYFASQLAQRNGSREPADHAAALHAARRWVRDQSKWQSPYYWGTFILLGPP